jgi:hypothetical protein
MFELNLWASKQRSVKLVARHSGSYRPCLEQLEDRLAPATFTVATTVDKVTFVGKLSLREAIQLANHSPGPDTIVLPSGHYKITIPGAGEQDNFRGDFDITDNLTIVGKGLTRPVVDGNGLDRVFNIQFTTIASVTFENLVITNGLVTGDGGGIHGTVAGDTITLINTSVIGNHASGKGGGIYNEGGPSP